MIIINKGNDDYGVEMIVMLIVAAATTSIFSAGASC